LHIYMNIMGFLGSVGAPRECVPEREQEPGCDRAREVEEKKEVRAEKSGTGRFRGIVRNVMEIFRTISVGREGVDERNRRFPSYGCGGRTQEACPRFASIGPRVRQNAGPFGVEIE
jgi:hypothetical protein